MFFDKKILLTIWLNPGLNLTISEGRLKFNATSYSFSCFSHFAMKGFNFVPKKYNIFFSFKFTINNIHTVLKTKKYNKPSPVVKYVLNVTWVRKIEGLN